MQLDIRQGHAQTVEKVLRWVDEEGGLVGATVCDAGCGTGGPGQQGRTGRAGAVWSLWPRVQEALKVPDVAEAQRGKGGHGIGCRLYNPELVSGSGSSSNSSSSGGKEGSGPARRVNLLRICSDSGIAFTIAFA